MAAGRNRPAGASARGASRGGPAAGGRKRARAREARERRGRSVARAAEARRARAEEAPEPDAKVGEVAAARRRRARRNALRVASVTAASSRSVARRAQEAQASVDEVVEEVATGTGGQEAKPADAPRRSRRVASLRGPRGRSAEADRRPDGRALGTVAEMVAERTGGTVRGTDHGSALRRVSRRASRAERADASKGVAARGLGDALGGRGLVGSLVDRVLRGGRRREGSPRVVGPSLAAMLAVALLVILSIFGATAGIQGARTGSTGSLVGNEAMVAQRLRARGLADVQVAAIVGNMVQESGCIPSACQEGGPARGLIQWEGERNGVRYGRFKTLCERAEAVGRDWSDVDVQIDFLMEELPGTFETYSDFLYTYDTGAVAGLGRHMSFDEWSRLTSLDEATEDFERVVCRGSLPAMDRRKANAQRVYAALMSTTGGGEEYASATEVQRAIVDAAQRTPARAAGFCLGWVYDAFQNAGADMSWRVYENAAAAYWSLCHSSDRSELKVGMLVAAPSTSGAPRDGHVGIYVGDGMVMHCTTGQVYTCTLDEWIAEFGTLSEVRWGFPPCISL